MQAQRQNFFHTKGSGVSIQSNSRDFLALIFKAYHLGLSLGNIVPQLLLTLFQGLHFRSKQISTLSL